MTDLAAHLISAARHLSSLGLSPGSSGNLSVLDGDRLLVTPTGSSLARVTETELAVVALDGTVLSGAPSKELPLHLAIYRHRKAARAVVHLHSPNATALACLDAGERPLRTVTPYRAMRFSDVPVLRYAPPGSRSLADGVAEAAVTTGTMLLANHGSVVSAPDLDAAVDLSEELESAAQIQLLLGRADIRPLPPGEEEGLRRSP